MYFTQLVNLFNRQIKPYSYFYKYNHLIYIVDLDLR
jgi:hypothetical protein